LVEKGHVQDYLVTQGRPDALANLAAEAKRRIALGTGSRARRHSHQIGSGQITRAWAIAHVAAAEAAARPDVTAFRTGAMRRGPARFNDVPTWIRNHAGRRGTTLVFEIFKNPSRGEKSYFRRLPVTRSPVLASLKQIAADVARTYGWEEWEAVYFILVGDAVPIRRPVVTSYLLPPAGSGLSRIVLSIDPTTPPRSVLDFYEFARRNLIGLRHRAMSEKHMRLAAAFAARPRSERLASQMAEWNRAHPKWRYSAVTNFGRDKVVARQRLIEPNYNRAPDPQERERAESVKEDQDE
jgi:hypothetical protein